ncbi:MAG: hypothetical protein Q7T50_02785 [Candidatus Magasanikbacteria bacterium]|nr:hypothetical protein [Candidatus Magasanikbacteria bacterium]
MTLTAEEIKKEITMALPEKGSIYFFTDKIDKGVEVLSKYSGDNAFCRGLFEKLKVIQDSYQGGGFWEKTCKYRFPFSSEDVTQVDSTSELVLKGEADFVKFVLDSLDIKSSIFTSEEGHSLLF